MEPFTAKIEGHLCDPKNECEIHGHEMTISVRKGPELVFELIFVSVMPDPEFRTLTKTIKKVISVDSAQGDDPSARRAMYEALNAYCKKHDTCSGWARETGIKSLPNSVRPLVNDRSTFCSFALLVVLLFLTLEEMHRFKAVANYGSE